MRCSSPSRALVAAVVMTVAAPPVIADDSIDFANTRAADAYARAHPAPAWLRGRALTPAEQRAAERIRDHTGHSVGRITTEIGCETGVIPLLSSACDKAGRPAQLTHLGAQLKSPLLSSADNSAAADGKSRQVSQAGDQAAPVQPPAPPGASSSSLSASTYDTDKRIIILLSAALGHSQLREIYQSAGGRDEVLLVYRGVAKGATLNTFMAGVYRDVKGIDPPPDVVIDPKWFPATAVSVAPEMLMLDRGRVIGRARGTTDIDGFIKRIVARRRALSRAEEAVTVTDLGKLGPTVAVSEPDLIAELKRRLAALDLKSIRDQTAGRFWDSAHLVELPESTRDRTRVIDMTIEARADITAPDGTVIAHAGDRVNPLKVRPFNQRLVVFDASRPKQLSAARRVADEPGARRITYLITGIDRDRGWDGFRKIEDALDAPVYLLTPDVRRRFRIERTPSVVEVRDDAMTVREIGMHGEG